MPTNIREIQFENLTIKYNEEFFNEQTRQKIKYIRNKTIFSRILLTTLLSSLSVMIIAYMSLHMYFQPQTRLIDASLILLNVFSIANQIKSTYDAMPRIQDKAVVRAGIPQYYRLIEIAEAADTFHINNEDMGEVFVNRNGKKEFIPLPFFKIECIGKNVTTYEQRETNEGLMVEIDCTRKDYIYLAFKDGPKEQKIDKENYMFANRREFRSMNLLDSLMKNIEQLNEENS